MGKTKGGGYRGSDRGKHVDPIFGYSQRGGNPSLVLDDPWRLIDEVLEPLLKVLYCVVAKLSNFELELLS